jgi:hypothetical protein
MVYKITLKYFRGLQSEDVRLIREEVEQATRDVERLTRLRDWCAKLDWVSSNANKTNPKYAFRFSLHVCPYISFCLPVCLSLSDRFLFTEIYFDYYE